MKLTGGDALARQLVREGVSDVFGIPGVQLDWATDGLRKVEASIRLMVGRHEQAASYMADGYARTTGRVGVCMADIEPQGAWVRALRRAIPDDGILVNELTQVGYFARLAYPVHAPRTFIGPGYQGTLGYGFPTALGAAAGNPDKAVVSINGDGGFGWGMQELATARKYGLNIAIVVFNDGHFGNVRTLQEGQFGTAFGVELVNPDYRTLAAAFAIPYRSADTPEALEAALKDNFAAGGPMLIEAQVGRMPSPWHLLRLVPPPFVAGRAVPPNPLGAPPAQG